MDHSKKSIKDLTKQDKEVIMKTFLTKIFLRQKNNLKNAAKRIPGKNH